MLVQIFVRILSVVYNALKKTGLLPLVKRLLSAHSEIGAEGASAGFRYNIRLLIEQATFAAVAKVHDLPPIHHYWSNKYLRPVCESFGFSSIEEFFVQELLEILRRQPEFKHRILSIGSGNCDFELELAKRLVQQGARNFCIECMDINVHMLRRGEAAASSAGLSEFLQALCADFNSWQSEPSRYSAVLANQSLHHVVNLEGLLDAVKRGLAPGGRLLISDMIGRNGHQRWPEAATLVDEFWRQLPPAYRFDHQTRRVDREFVDRDCAKASFEGVRAQDILPLLLQRFAFRAFLPFANIIDVFVGRGIGPNFDPNKATDREFIDRVHHADAEAMRTGRIKPTHMIAALTVEAQTQTRCPEGLTPEFCVRRA